MSINNLVILDDHRKVTRLVKLMRIFGLLERIADHGKTLEEKNGIQKSLKAIVFMPSDVFPKRRPKTFRNLLNELTAQRKNKEQRRSKKNKEEKRRKTERNEEERRTKKKKHGRTKKEAEQRRKKNKKQEARRKNKEERRREKNNEGRITKKEEE